MSNEQNNGEKTEEELLQERLERYKADPKQFVELSDIVAMAIRNPKSPIGLSIYLGHAKRSEFDIAEAELNHRLRQIRIQLEISAKMKSGKIVKPNFLGGLRKHLGGK